ncbi:3-methyl-2-oxobutanoate hydroxymethyltransferase [Rhizobium sp. B209b/85]|uniref:3-methyl-2-oxobutanoate hydroxymethyltransferase n=1 Tax=Rhizobium sp. B209b/85 TaxID=2819992 RepID=UPI0028AF151A|nr:3-methyl-2-oxobutanoate hydroxymethyltransferase [Rhizobium sp. B209b/85]
MAARKADHPLQRYGSARALAFATLHNLHHPAGHDQESPEQAFRNAAILMRETCCEAVSLERGREMAETVRYLVNRGVPVMGHIGLTPQSVHAFGGYRVQGKGAESAAMLQRDAAAIADAGAFAIVLEKVTKAIADTITKEVKVPTIGIGASDLCDGQILVVDDLLGLFGEFRPKFVKRYAELANAASTAVGDYAREVQSRQFPSEKYLFS